MMTLLHLLISCIYIEKLLVSPRNVNIPVVKYGIFEFVGSVHIPRINIHFVYPTVYIFYQSSNVVY